MDDPEAAPGSTASLYGVAENDSKRTTAGTLNSDRKENPSVEPKSRSCRGCLFYSNTLRDSGRNPICIGLSRAESQGYSMMGETEWEVTKDGKRLGDFKYACLGYSSHKEHTSVPVSPTLPAEGQAELPVCVGLEFLVDKRAPRGSSPAEEQYQGGQQGHQNPELQRDAWRENAGQPNSAQQHRPPLADDEFPARFIRCAKLVASAVVRNSERVAGAIKGKLDDIFYPDRGKPKR